MNNYWPVEKLEYLEFCPICLSTNREVLYPELTDNVFFCSEDAWKLWRCLNCFSGYLSPRPSLDSIGLAYSNYYTHAVSNVHSNEETENLSYFRRLKKALANGYRNAKYNTNFEPQSKIGYYIINFLPQLRKIIDLEFRNLQFTKSDERYAPSLLDIGCGNGVFIHRMSLSGWHVIGIDPDSNALKAANTLGVTVLEGGVEIFGDKTELFDAITLSHSIEHVHDPVSLIRACYRLLKPNGIIWIDTPNINSLGHAFFKHNWRGLEPPRHLVLFNFNSLEKVLKDEGFSKVKFLDRPSPNYSLFMASHLMSKNLSPYTTQKIPIRDRVYIKIISIFADIIQSFTPEKREFITATAVKPPN